MPVGEEGTCGGPLIKERKTKKTEWQIIIILFSLIRSIIFFFIFFFTPKVADLKNKKILNSRALSRLGNVPPTQKKKKGDHFFLFFLFQFLRSRHPRINRINQSEKKRKENVTKRTPDWMPRSAYCKLRSVGIYLWGFFSWGRGEGGGGVVFIFFGFPFSAE